MLNQMLGQYRLIEVIGQGGMATVYRAHQASLDRFVAVKVLQHHGNAEYVARFKAEARSLALLQHPNILPVYDYGEQDDVLYLVLQFIPGGASLADLAAQGARPSEEVLQIGLRLLDGLAYAHGKGIVHRDIKPANILLPQANWPMLADFGLSKLLSASGLNLTMPGTIMGTVGYMPPEQVTTQPIDVRSDIYSTGVVFYQLLTGQLPFDGATAMEVLVKHAYAPLPSPREINPTIPVPLEQVVLRAMAKSPADRYQTATAMADDLRRVADRAAAADASSARTISLSAVDVPPPPPVASTPTVASTPAVASTPPVASTPAAPAQWPSWVFPAVLVAALVALVGAAAALWAIDAQTAAAPTAAPTAAAAAPTSSPLAATATLPAATEAVATPAPTGDAGLAGDPGGASGSVSYRDAALWSDAATVAVRGLSAPPAGQVYAAWLSNASGSLFLGVLSPDAGGDLAVSYVSPAHQNLVGSYDRVYIAQVPEAAAEAEVANVVLMGALPAEPLSHLRHALFSYEATPNKIGFLTGLRREADEALVHAERLAKQLEEGNLAGAQGHAEHVVNIIEGQYGEHFGDLNKDGRVQQPGDGFGLLPNGAQEGYIAGVLHHVLVAASAPGAPETLRGGADGVEELGAALEAQATKIRDLSLRIADAKDATAARADAEELLALARGLAGGESDVETIYERAQGMAQVALAPPPPGQISDAPPPVRVVAEAQPELVIEVGDDIYTPGKQTVPPGTTLVWKNVGKTVHTVTADDGSFDSKNIAPGESFSYTFTKVEAFPYFCTLHGGAHGEGMAGSIEVQAPAAAQP
jgi:serine/threonine-protein kinase